MKKDFFIRPAMVGDINDIVRLRRVMFESMGYDDAELLNKNDQFNKNYFYENIANKNFNGWVALTSKNVVVGTVGLVIDQHPPSPNNPSGKIGYIMNLCVDKEFRRQGIARHLMNTILDYTKKIKIQVTELHATEIGRGLYADLGYKDCNAMRLTI